MRTTKGTFSRPDRDYRIFYLFMTLVIGAVYISTLMTEPSLREPWRLTVFSLLMIAHIGLHWFLERFAVRGWTLAYILVQGILALVLSSMASTVQMVFGLFMPLLGEVTGLFGLNRKTLLALFYYLALSVVSLLRVTGAGSLGWWAVAIIPGAVFTILYTTLYVRQSQARERAQDLLQELEIANRKLSEYAAQVEDLTITSERQRMARELHDTLSQGLAGLILQLEAADAHLSGGRGDRAQAIVRKTMDGARATLADARRAIDDLRSPDAPGLSQAARREAERFTQATGIPCEVEIALPLPVPLVPAEAGLRVVTEGLTNIARHARATRAGLRIGILPEDGELKIEVSDDGVGFDPESVGAGHYGLLGIQERVRLAGGSFELRTATGKGTRLLARFPLEGGPRD